MSVATVRRMRGRRTIRRAAKRVGQREMRELVGDRPTAVQDRALPVTPRLVTVWDRELGRYREVSLSNRRDPLWPAARALSQHSIEASAEQRVEPVEPVSMAEAKTAAAGGGQSAPPRSPFGGGNCVAEGFMPESSSNCDAGGLTSG